MNQLSILELQNRFSRPGKVVAICTRPARITQVIFHTQILAVENKGLAGDRYKNTGTRQVTLISVENLKAATSYIGKEVRVEDVRRNILVDGINLLALKGKRFFLGDAVLEFTGECHPCSRMEAALGMGGYNAMRGNGGITARILKSGTIRLGDVLQPIL